MECKRNPKGFWKYVNKNTKAKTTIGDLKWCNSSIDIVLAESDKDKAIALQDFFICIYTVSGKKWNQ